MKFQQHFANIANLQDIAKFQKIQLDNLVDFEKCCKTHIFLQKSVPIQPKTSNILPDMSAKSAVVSHTLLLAPRDRRPRHGVGVDRLAQRRVLQELAGPLSAGCASVAFF